MFSLFCFFPQRDELFSTYSAWVMCKAGFDVVDVLPLTHSYPKGTIDHVHYRHSVFIPLENMMEKLKVDRDQFYQQDGRPNTMKRCVT